MKIGIIGSGISGLASAWLLTERHDVVLFERDYRFGGHANTVGVPGAGLAVDTGFIVYNEPNYPNLTRLFATLGVPTRETDMSFAVSMDEGRYEWAGSSLSTVFGQRRNLLDPTHWRMLRDIVRFNADAKRILAQPAVGGEQTLGAYLAQQGYSNALRDRYLIPMAAAIWSCPTETMLAFPLVSFLRFFDNHGLLHLYERPRWRTVVGGSRVYVYRLVEQIWAQGEIHSGCGAASVMRRDERVEVVDDQGRVHHFDAVVFACQADQALALLDQPRRRERDILGAFAYQPNRAVLHTDTSLMPKRRRLWSAWNYHAATGTDAGRVSVSYWMNRLQGLPGEVDYLVTLNPLRAPAPNQVVTEIDYRHPVFTAAAIKAQEQIDEIQGAGGIWYCGSYLGYGFHEDGLRSAVALAHHFDVRAPWQRERVLTKPYLVGDAAYGALRA